MRKSSLVDVKVSVIVPVYNGEKWINRCLQSLINQTLKDIEIICVNDCSLDNSLAILKEYAKKDKRILIKDLKRNGGESVARNNGLKIAKGKYIAFIDQDDYIDLDFYEKLYEHTKHGNIDIVKGNVKTKTKGIETVSDLHLKVAKNKFNFLGNWWSAIYKAAFLRNNNIDLPQDLILGGDGLFLTEAVVNANRVATIDNSFYHYIKRANSGYSKILDYRKINSLFLSFSRMLSCLNNYKINKKNYTMLFYAHFSHFLSLFNRSSSKKNKFFVCEKAFELYKICKYKLSFKESIAKNLEEKILNDFLHCLNENDKAELFRLLTQVPNALYPKINLNSQRKYIYIWGKGKDSESVIWQCKRNGWSIAGFLDSSEKTGTISPIEILKKKIKNYFIIISSRRHSFGIAKTCEQAGLKEGLDFWRPK